MHRKLLLDRPEVLSLVSRTYPNGRKILGNVYVNSVITKYNAVKALKALQNVDAAMTQVPLTSHWPSWPRQLPSGTVD